MYTEESWKKWSDKEENNYQTINNKRRYLKKGYTHFDNKFWFPENKEKLRRILASNLLVNNPKTKKEEYYSFSPFLKLLVKTPRYRYQETEKHYDLETKIRPICFASHLDSLILSFYSYALNELYQDYIKKYSYDDCVLAYRSDLGKCNIQFSKEVFDIVKERGECTTICLDIKGYFDNIDHILLKEKWCKILDVRELPEDQYRLYKILTRYSYVNANSILKKYDVDKKKLKKKGILINTLLDHVPGIDDVEKFNRLRADRLIVKNEIPNANMRYFGIPQGSAISALLSNIYLIDYDKEMKELGKKKGFIYRRYCDDILIICNSNDAANIQKIAIDKICNDCLLTIQDKKVELIEFKKNTKGIIRAFDKKKMILNSVVAIPPNEEKKYYKPLQYLGFEYDGKAIRLRATSLSRYYRKMKARIVKTVGMAYSSKSTEKIIRKEQLFFKYSHSGERNFITYAYNAAADKYQNAEGEWKDGMNSKAIKQQLKRHIDILVKTLNEKSNQRFNYKSKKGKATILKS